MWKQAAEGQQEIERNCLSLFSWYITGAKIRYIFFCILASKLSYLIVMTGSDFYTSGAA